MEPILIEQLINASQLLTRYYLLVTPGRVDMRLLRIRLGMQCFPVDSDCVRLMHLPACLWLSTICNKSLLS